MIRKCRIAMLGIFAITLMLGVAARPAPAQDQQQSQQSSYTPAEYNAYKATTAITSPQDRVKALDDFVSKFPGSTILPYVYKDYMDAYQQVKNYGKVIEYADKALALPDNQQVQPRIQTLYVRCSDFEFALNVKAGDAKDQLTKTHDACLSGIKLLEGLTKPANMTDAQFADQKKPAAALFYSAAGFASLQLKEYAAAADSYKNALANNNKDAVGYYRLGVALLAENPPQNLDGFWALARSVALKGPGEAQVRDYLRKRMLAYQQPGCDSLIDPQMNEMIQLAANSADRPATYTLSSSADLEKVRQSSNIVTVLSDLQAGGDKAKLTWLTVCGSDFPAVVGKIIELTPGAASVDFKVFTSSNADEMQKATTANMDVVVPGQPEAARLQKEDPIQFSGTLVSYDPQPLMLHWDKAKVDASVIPEEKGKKPARKPATKKPGKTQ